MNQEKIKQKAIQKFNNEKQYHKFYDVHADFNKDKFPQGKQRTDQFLLKIVYGNACSLGSHPGKIETLSKALTAPQAGGEHEKN